MLSSIHPLGERTRNNRWSTTVAAFTLGAVGTAAAVGALLGWAGSRLVDLETGATIAAMGAIALTAGALDTFGVPVPGPQRQVNEHWIGSYRGWIYGGAFGVQLGAGLTTYVVTWGVYATLSMELLSGSAFVGAVIGAVFGLGRSVGLLVAGRIDRASRLTQFHDNMARLGPVMSIVSGYGVVVLGAVSIAGALLWRV